MQIDASKCPWCGNTIPQAKFVEIETRIRDEEKKKLALFESELKRKYEEQSRLQVEREVKRTAEKEQKAAEERIREQTSKLQSERDSALQTMKAIEVERKAADEQASEQARKLQAERDSVLQKMKALEAKEAVLRKEMSEQAERDLKKAIEAERRAADERASEQTRKLQTERDSVLQKMKALEAKEAVLRKEMSEQAERDLKKAIEVERKAADERASEQTRKLQTELDSALEKMKASGAREAALKKQMSEEAEKKLNEELTREREVYARDRDQRERKLKAEFTRDHEKTKNKIAALERQLQKKTANELGDGAEIDLYEELRTLFRGDHITRVPKGERGADIHHEVYYKGQSCGKIVYDSKNRQLWKEEYASKLRADQTAAGAMHAILSTNSFPKGKKELCISHDVIAVSPARVGCLVELLRNAMVRMHVLNLSHQERSGKMAELYKLISSDVFNQGFREADKVTQDILDLDVKEVRAHEDVWRKRGFLTKRLKNVLTEVQTEISAIVERVETNRGPKAPAVVAEFRPSTNTLPRN